MNKQVLVSMKDLRYATLLCRHCNTRVTLDFASEFQPGSGATPFKAPTECPRCGSAYDSAVPGSVNGMQKIYRAVAGLGDALSFHGDPEPSSGF